MPTDPATFVYPDTLRARFAEAMSAMYRAEVPLYGQLVALVGEINRDVLAQDAPSPFARGRIEGERHGAIRLGTAAELRLVARAFAVLGMAPVGYYDLAPAGLPVHSTAFRPIDPAGLDTSPFRIFTSLLRLELIEPPALRKAAEGLLRQRAILTPEALRLLDLAERDGGLGEADGRCFIETLIDTFRWHSQASVTAELYAELSARHRLIADVVGFRGPHINHLTPRVLDIDRAQQRMVEQGFDPKDVIEGPSQRTCPVLLRQTSFKALAEPIHFPMQDGASQPGVHVARFGEIEQRGVALTPEGRVRYDAWIAHGGDLSALLPDDWDELRRQGLAFFRYRICSERAADRGTSVEALIEAGAIAAEPILYEDFLPVSAAGIFRSNLGASDPAPPSSSQGDRTTLEQAIGQAPHRELDLYARESRASLEACRAELAEQAGSD